MPEREEILERLVRLEEGQKDMKDDLRAIRTQIEGPPREDSLRGRLHKLEGSEAAAKAAEAALKAVTAMRLQAGDRRFSRRDKLVTAAVGVGLLVSQWVAPLIYHHP